MDNEYNIWRPLDVNGVFIGDYIHHYEKTVGEEVIWLGSFGKLVKTNVTNVTEYYVIGLRSEQIGIYVPQLVLDKYTFERLINSKFTRVVDYFVMAKNCIGVFPCDGSLMEFQNKRSQEPGYKAEEDDNVKFYSFNDKEHNIHFDFVIDFYLQ